MCSITGIFGKNDQELIKSMNESMSYRGPDDIGYFSDKNIELGHNRLSILDISNNGHQPMCNENKGVWLVFNGEIYNFQSLRKDLIQKGHFFSSKTDTETIIHAYEEYGDRFLEKLDGMFSFAIYDKRKNRLILARDRIGVKPLYYIIVDGMLLFASEMKALLKYQKIKPKMADYDLNNYFDFSSSTSLAGIYQLKPGHYISAVLNNGVLHYSDQIAYWEPNKTIIEQDEQVLTKNLRELFEESIKQRMVSDVPIALFFSGGIDSTILTYFAKKYHNHTLKAFTIGTEDRDEIDIARNAAAHLDLEFIPIKLFAEDIINIIPKIIYHLEDYDPRNVELSVLIYFLSKEARKHGIKVVLCGEGADELFCGYRNFFPDYFKGGEYTKENVQEEVFKWIRGLNSNHLKNKDRGTMALGLELRLPYIDHLGFFELASRIDPFLKMKNNQEKYILRKMMRPGELPEHILNQKKKYFHIESGIPFIINKFFGFEDSGSLVKRFEIYKDIFNKIFIQKEDHNVINLNHYK